MGVIKCESKSVGTHVVHSRAEIAVRACNTGCHAPNGRSRPLYPNGDQALQVMSNCCFSLQFAATLP